MCGIAATFAYGTRSADPTGVQRACDRMAPRGPDGAGLWVGLDERVALGHRRLAIIDLSEDGAQPMAAGDGGPVITFNGEIYNYEALRRGLEERGHRFRSSSDTEVLLRLYQEKGAALVEDLRGMFAFALWDPARQGLLLARDPYGIKPLYVADDGETIRLASQVKAVLAMGGIDIRPDPAGHAGFFLWGHVPEPHTLYRGIRSLPAGHTLWVDAQGARAPEPYATIPDALRQAEAETPAVDPAHLDEAVREALLDSVRAHLVADVDVGVFLSAGRDSTTLAALAAEVGGRPTTVTLGFEAYRGTPDDEVPLAEVAAAHFDTDHRTVWVARGEFEALCDGFLDAMDQPSTDGLNTFLVSRAAAQAGLKVVLSGLGGDELFGGYPSFAELPRLVRLVGAVPGSAVWGRGVRAASAPLLGRLTSPKAAGLAEYGGTFGGAYLLRRGYFMPWELPSVLGPDLAREGLAALDPVGRLAETTEGITSDHLKVVALESSHYMRGQLLRDSDWASMAHSLELRVPLVDWALLRRIAPLAARWPEAVDKAALARAGRPALPAAIADRPKTGFTTPIQRWLVEAGRVDPAERGLRGWARAVYRHHADAPLAEVV